MMNDFDKNFNEEEEILFKNKRRFTDDGVRIGQPEEANSEEDVIEAEPIKAPEIIKLESELRDISMRAAAAESKLIEVQKRYEEERDNLERETAERRERMLKSLEQKADAGRFDFLNSLLPVLDNLNLAVDAGEGNTSYEDLLTGVKSTARSFEQAILGVGVEPIKSVGETFNPEIHEAVDIVESSKENEGKITAEYSRGYTFNGRLLRAARVQVGKGPENQ